MTTLHVYVIVNTLRFVSDDKSGTVNVLSAIGWLISVSIAIGPLFGWNRYCTHSNIHATECYRVHLDKHSILTSTLTPILLVQLNVT